MGVFSPFSNAITSLGEEKAGLCAFRACILLRALLAATCDCGTTWTFRFYFFEEALILFIKMGHRRDEGISPINDVIFDVSYTDCVSVCIYCGYLLCVQYYIPSTLSAFESDLAILKSTVTDM